MMSVLLDTIREKLGVEQYPTVEEISRAFEHVIPDENSQWFFETPDGWRNYDGCDNLGFAAFLFNYYTTIGKDTSKIKIPISLKQIKEESDAIRENIQLKEALHQAATKDKQITELRQALEGAVRERDSWQKLVSEYEQLLPPRTLDNDETGGSFIGDVREE